jgi:hypothetical protein
MDLKTGNRGQIVCARHYKHNRGNKMANKDNLIKLVAQKLGPDNLKQMVDQAVQALGNDPDVTPEVISQMINLFGQVAENPESYQSVIQEAIQAGVLDQGDFPEQFDPIFIGIFLLALQGLQQRGGQGFARGGLSQAAQQVQAQGRDSDTILAHISPHEAAFLKRLGGAGTINPQTGLMEFGLFKKIKKAVKSVVKVIVPIAKAVLPIAVSMIPGIGPVAAAALSGLGTAALGGNLKQSLLAGVGGALGTVDGQTFAGSIGKSLTPMVPTSLSGILTPTVLGSGVLGGATTALAGGNVLKGALTAGATNYLAPQVADAISGQYPGAENVTASMVRGANTAAQMGSNPIVGAGTAGLISVGGNLLNDGTFLGTPPTVAGQPPSTIQGNGTGVVLDPATGDPFASADPYALPTSQAGGSQGVDLGSYAPTDSVINAAGNYDFNLFTPSNSVNVPAPQGVNFQETGVPASSPLAPVKAPTAGPLTQAAATTAAGAPSVKGTPSSDFKWGDIATIGLLSSLVAGKTPKQANDAIMQDPALTEQQKQGMLRKLTNYKFDPGMTVFPQQGTAEWDRLMKQINQGVEQTYATPTLTEQPAMARGGRNARRQPQGALSQMSRLSLGAGDGRSDSIEARLSDGEYVIDAETVALLGNGSTKAGAAMLDQMRQQIRQQKGKALAKGKFSPDAKSPLAYMKGGLK